MNHVVSLLIIINHLPEVSRFSLLMYGNNMAAYTFTDVFVNWSQQTVNITKKDCKPNKIVRWIWVRSPELQKTMVSMLIDMSDENWIIYSIQFSKHNFIMNFWKVRFIIDKTKALLFLLNYNYCNKINIKWLLFFYLFFLQVLMLWIHQENHNWIWKTSGEPDRSMLKRLVETLQQIIWMITKKWYTENFGYTQKFIQIN